MTCRMILQWTDFLFQNPETAEKFLPTLKVQYYPPARRQPLVCVFDSDQKESRQIAWNWLKENWAWVEDTFGENKEITLSSFAMPPQPY